MIMNKGVSVALVMGSFLLMSATSKPQEPRFCQAPEGEFVIYGELQNVPTDRSLNYCDLMAK